MGRIDEPDGEFLSRDAVQNFVQNPKNPALLENHDNDYLHYQDDWYILDYNNNEKEGEPFVVVYYRGSNDAWDGYGGCVVYTRASAFPQSIHDRVATAVSKVNNWDFEKDFTITDNTCMDLDSKEVLSMREKFLGKVAIQSEKQLLQQSVKLRNNASNVIKKEEKVIEKVVREEEKIIENALREEEKIIERALKKEEKAVEKAINKLIKITNEFEKEILEEAKGLMSAKNR